jgi:hypothetical protein
MSAGLSPSELVTKAEAILEKAKEDERLEKLKPEDKRQKFRFWEQTSQLRNLVQIVQTESEVPVLRNFIHYQMGRRSTRDFWVLIGSGVIKALEGIEAEAAKVENVEATRKRAIQNFFGYLVRHYVYVNETQRPKDPKDRNDRTQDRQAGRHS